MPETRVLPQERPRWTLRGGPMILQPYHFVSHKECDNSLSGERASSTPYVRQSKEIDA